VVPHDPRSVRRCRLTSMTASDGTVGNWAVADPAIRCRDFCARGSDGLVPMKIIPGTGSVTLNRRNPPLAELRVFEAAARHLSFTRAATELGVTQGAISQRIRHLED